MGGRLLAVGAVLQTGGPKATEMRSEAFAFLTRGLRSDNLIVKAAACKGIAFLVTPSPQKTLGEEERKGKYRAAAQAAIHAFAADIASAMSDRNFEDTRVNALTALKEVFPPSYIIPLT